MFTSSSRYANLQDEQLTAKDGTVITYKERRFLPLGEDMLPLQLVNVVAGDRIDLVTYRTLGDPEQFWQVCDANNAMYPLELTARPGRVLVIPSPGT
jgi:hypothetical protein